MEDFCDGKEFLKFIKNDQSILEREPLENVSKRKQLAAFRHNRFWYCMDTKRERDVLNNLIKKGKAPWLRKMSRKNLLVIGGTGFLGSHFLKRSIKKKFNTFSISNNRVHSKKKIIGVKYFHCNCLDEKKLKNYLSIKNLIM